MSRTLHVPEELVDIVRDIVSHEKQEDEVYEPEYLYIYDDPYEECDGYDEQLETEIKIEI